MRPRFGRAILGLRVGLVVLCVMGVAASVYLTKLHYQAHTQPESKSFCSLSKEVNCLSVAESPYAMLLGVPVSVWGLLAYLALGGGVLLLLIRRRWPPFVGVTFLAALGSLLVAGVMAGISQYVIKSFCIVCGSLYVVNFLLFVVALFVAVFSGGVGVTIKADLRIMRAGRGTVLGLGGLGAAVAGLMMMVYPTYWKLHEPVGPGGLKHGATAEGHPWIGARDPVLTIHEFSDYQCGFCRRFNAMLRATLNKAEFKGKVRVVHYHYPLDQRCNKTVPHEFHRRACELARAAICAQAQGRFWEMNDLLFRRQRRQGGPDVLALASKLELDLGRFEKCLGAAETKQQLLRDLRAGERMAKKVTGQGIPGTPFYLFERPGEELRRGHAYERYLRREMERTPRLTGPSRLRHGLNGKGQPWIGARAAKLWIYELSDYECYFCRRAHARVRRVLEDVKNGLSEKVRLVHLQYPLGHKCNPSIKEPQHLRACKMARAAVCAKKQGKFWEMNDLLYTTYRRRGAPRVSALARRLKLDLGKFQECLRGEESLQAVKQEIFFGEKLGARDNKGIEGVPTYFYTLPGKEPVRGLPPTRTELENALRGKIGTKGAM